MVRISETVDNRVLILPVGSTEQHRPHLPLGVDTIIATQFSLAIAQEISSSSPNWIL
ncbi:creatininase family protein [Bacillus salipaludis]|uniref:creatininase family protein n=1 Tax=Bacillus salipaludis TaxID=2547811 RepID=UPI003AF31FE0